MASKPGERGRKGGRGGRRGGRGGRALQVDVQVMYDFIGKCITRPDVGFVGKLFDDAISDFVKGYREHKRKKENQRKSQLNMKKRKRAVSKVYTSPR